MMNKIFLFLMVISCSQLPRKRHPPEGFVSGETALSHIKQSYLAGCVEAHKEHKVTHSFILCRTKAENHRAEIEKLMEEMIEVNVP